MFYAQLLLRFMQMISFNQRESAGEISGAALMCRGYFVGSELILLHGGRPLAQSAVGFAL